MSIYYDKLEYKKPLHHVSPTASLHISDPEVSLSLSTIRFPSCTHTTSGFAMSNKHYGLVLSILPTLLFFACASEILAQVKPTSQQSST
jgi:hypothetical protein